MATGGPPGWAVLVTAAAICAGPLFNPALVFEARQGLERTSAAYGLLVRGGLMRYPDVRWGIETRCRRGRRQ